jgi:endonuclease YncB( thermonuclease family)
MFKCCRKLTVSVPVQIPNSKYISWADTKPFISPLYENTNYYVIKVYDGDTITIAANVTLNGINYNLYRFPIRIRGIDAPEMASKNEDEKEIALIAKNTLNNLILNHRIQLKNIGSEKYGRILADVYFNNQSIGDIMLNKKLCVSYTGKKKQPPKSWKKYYNTGSVE